MVTCKFWLQGNCRYGDNCRFEHTKSGAGPNGRDAGVLTGPETFENVSRTIQDDLTVGKEQPGWKMSVYAPIKFAANIVDQSDLSFEELRHQAYEARASNNLQQYAQQESQYVAKMDEVFNRLARDPLNAYRNFYNTRVPFNAPVPAPPQASAFGQPTGGGGFGAFASQPRSAFGQPPPASAFGQPSQGSAFGQSAQTPAFGQPAQASAFGQPAQTSAFGQAPQTSAFGQPSQSAVGQPVQSSAFGAQPASGGGFAAFASSTPSAFGQSAATAPGSAFSRANAVTSAFGQPSGAFAQANQGTFGQSASNSAFGQPSAPASTPAGGGGGGFAAWASKGPSAFGGGAAAPSSASANPFGGSTSTPVAQSSFRATPAPSGTLGQPAQTGAFGGAGPQAQPTAFGQPATSAFGAPNPSPSSAFGAPPSQPSAFGGPPSTGTGTVAFAPQPAAAGQKWPKRNPELLKLDLWAADAGKEEDLPPDVLAAFKAPDFEWGKIPFQVPPLSLRI